MIKKLEKILAAGLATIVPAAALAQSRQNSPSDTTPIVLQTSQSAQSPAYDLPTAIDSNLANYSMEIADKVKKLGLKDGEHIKANTMYGDLSIRYGAAESSLYDVRLSSKNHNITAHVYFDTQNNPTGLLIADAVTKKPDSRFTERHKTVSLPSKVRFIDTLFGVSDWELVDSYTDGGGDGRFDGQFDRGMSYDDPGLFRLSPKGVGLPTIDYAGPTSADRLSTEERREFQERFEWREMLVNAALRVYAASEQNAKRLLEKGAIPNQK